MAGKLPILNKTRANCSGVFTKLAARCINGQDRGVKQWANALLPGLVAMMQRKSGRPCKKRAA